MSKAPKIDGFSVEVIPTFRRGSTVWAAWLTEQPTAKAEGGGYDEALKALTARWDEIKAAHRAAGQPIPTPARRRGNKRILDTIRRLGERKTVPIF